MLSRYLTSLGCSGARLLNLENTTFITPQIILLNIVNIFCYNIYDEHGIDTALPDFFSCKPMEDGIKRVY